MGILDFFKTRKLRKRKGTLSGVDRELIRSEWKEIQQLLNLNKPSTRKQALIRADKVLDLALKRMVKGESLGERLKNAQDVFSSWEIYDNLWKAHKIRNKMVHEAGFEPPHYVIKDALEKIRRGLEDLGATLK